MKQISKNLLIFLRLAVGLLIIGALVYKLDFAKVCDTVLEMNLFVIPLLLLMLVNAFLMTTIILKTLLSSLNVKINFKDLLGCNITSWSLGRFLPARAGELSLMYFLKKDKVDYGKGAAVFIISRLINFMSLIIIGVFGLFLFLTVDEALKITAFLIATITIICFLILCSTPRNFVKKYILRKYASKFKGFSKNLNYIIRKRKKVLLATFLLNFARITINALIISLIFLLFGINVFFFIVLIIGSLGNLTLWMPVSIAGLGVKEVAVVYLYSQAGVSALIVGSVYLLVRTIHFIVAGIVLIFSKKFFKK